MPHHPGKCCCPAWALVPTTALHTPDIGSLQTFTPLRGLPQQLLGFAVFSTSLNEVSAAPTKLGEETPLTKVVPIAGPFPGCSEMAHQGKHIRSKHLAGRAQLKEPQSLLAQARPPLPCPCQPLFYVPTSP